MKASDFKEKIESDIQKFLAEKYNQIHDQTGLKVKDIELIPIVSLKDGISRDPYVVKLTLF